MPCKVPNQQDPMECISEATCKLFHDDNHHHQWPSKGQLHIEKCEVYCWYCYELWGKTGKWKWPWYLRRHVDSVHAGKTHPELQPEPNPKHKQNGNAKPWRDAGIPAPMGRRRGTKCGLKTPPPAPAKKTPERKEPTTPTRQRATTPSRQQKRVAQKKKLNASARATPARKTPAWSTTSSPPALTIDTSFSTPGSQMQLPDGRTLTPSAFGFTGDDDNNNTNGTMNMHGNTSFGENASLPNYNAYGGLPSHLNGVGAGFDGWGDEFQTMNNGLLGHNFNGVIPGYEGLANGWDGTMRGLDLANNVGYDDSFSNIDRFGNDYTVANNSFSYNNNEEEIAFPDAKPTASAAGTHGLPEKATPQDVVLINQLCDAYAAPNHPTTMNGNAHDELTHNLHETLLVQLAAGNLSNDQALQVLNNVAANFKHA